MLICSPPSPPAGGPSLLAAAAAAAATPGRGLEAECFGCQAQLGTETLTAAVFVDTPAEILDRWRPSYNRPPDSLLGL